MTDRPANRLPGGGRPPFPEGWTYWCHVKPAEVDRIPWSPGLTVCFRLGAPGFPDEGLEVLIPKSAHRWLTFLQARAGAGLLRLMPLGSMARAVLWGAAHVAARYRMAGCAVLADTDNGKPLVDAVCALTGLWAAPMGGR